MPSKLIIRIHPDDRVQVKVEGMAESDQAKPKGEKLCERLTRRLEQDLGFVNERTYESPPERHLDQVADEGVNLGQEGTQ